MNTDQLNNLSIAQLIDLKNKAEQLIVIKQKEQKKDLISDFEAQAAKLGLSLEDVIGTTSPKGRKTKGKKVAPKYRNPHDSSVTWTGRGRRPLWVEAELKKGKTLEDLAI